MRRSVLCGSLVAAFAAGLLAARVAPPAEAQPSVPAAAQPAPPALTPQIINLLALSEEEIGPLVNNTDLRSRTLVATEQGTVAVQSGNVLKHFHADANEIQLVLDGAGSFWLGEREVQVRAGDLIIIPRGTVHAGSRASTGRFRALAIKLPPQRANDTHPVP
ncbi:cupin domain-containing protein [Roseomonas sp. BN140053]|uniref:cupin domain-containing protein n=1 Tax=Roseomonas sp. BN140053 TaxID=3391898 RepID=UPI0039E9ECA9